MKIGFLYRSFEDITSIVYTLSSLKLEIDNDETNSYFKFYDKNDEYIFSKSIEIINECDYKIHLFTTFNEWKQFKGFDKLIQTQIVENYHVTNDELKEYLDAGNISLSAASISFEHPNFFYDPIFNLVFFYYHYGYNFLNYYQFDKKDNLLGIYHKPDNGININKGHRNHLYKEISKNLKNDFISYHSNEYNMKMLFQPYIRFGHWGNNHITSYMDFTTSVCNVIFETLHSNGNDEEPENKMHGRQYITEKTLKAICFSEENIFFIWYGPTKLFKYLNDLGFWFLNSEFYNESIQIPQYNDAPYYSHMEDSVIQSANYLKKLKTKFKDNKLVHNYLIENYGEKLKNNVELFKKILNNYPKNTKLLKTIKNGNGNKRRKGVSS